MTVSEFFYSLKKELQHEDAAFEINQLFDRRFGKNARLLCPDRVVTDEDQAALNQEVQRLQNGYPLQYILGEWDFYGLTLKVGEGVLIPRPDTEISVETALDRLKGINAPVIADLCSGSGAIALAIAANCPDCTVYAVELFDAAMGYLLQNISALGLGGRVKPIKGDALSDLSGILPHGLDMIISNPPYVTADEMKELSPQVRCEPQTALFGGEDGLDFYRAISKNASKILAPGGSLIFEGGYLQAGDIERIMSDNGFENITSHKDLAGIERCVSVNKPL